MPVLIVTDVDGPPMIEDAGRNYMRPRHSHWERFNGNNYKMPLMIWRNGDFMPVIIVTDVDGPPMIEDAGRNYMRPRHSHWERFNGNF